MSCSNPSWPYPVLQSGYTGLDSRLLSANLSAPDWMKIKAWAVVRATGRWPFPLVGVAWMPDIVDVCPCCDSQAVGVCHILTACPGTSHLRKLHQLPPKNGSALLNYIFQSLSYQGDSFGDLSRYHYVYEVFAMVAEVLQSDATIEHFIKLAT